MKIIIFKGGLGNQMFQYVFFNYLKKRNFKKVYGYFGRRELAGHNGLEIANVFQNISLPKETFWSKIIVLTSKLLNKILSRNVVLKDDLFHKDDTIYDGYWHNIAFFDSNSANLFNFNTNLDLINSENLNKIKISNSIAIHVRRGDYLSHKNVYGDVCSQDYYRKSIGFFCEKFEDCTFVFFSDDMKWVKENFNMEGSIYIDNNSRENSYLDMFLMSNCKHNIIANSTFSWWGAFLNQNKNKIVIMPSRWYNNDVNNFNLFIDDWIKF